MFTAKLVSDRLKLKLALASNLCTALFELGFLEKVGIQKVPGTKGRGATVYAVDADCDVEEFFEQLARLNVSKNVTLYGAKEETKAEVAEDEDDDDIEDEDNDDTDDGEEE